MQLENEFTVPASIDQAWAVLLDVPRVAPCLPGATVEDGGGEDGEYKGQMKIKIGPITASYKGTVKIQEADEAAHRVAMRAQAKDARGQGTAAATITSTMEEVADGTKITRRHRHARHRPGRPVRPRRDAGRLREADDALRRVPGRADAGQPGRRDHRRGRGRGRPRPPRRRPRRPPPSRPTRRPRSRTPACPAPPRACRARRPSEVPSASSGQSSATTARPTDDVLDLGEASRDAVLKRALPVIGGVVALLILLRLIRR